MKMKDIKITESEFESIDCTACEHPFGEDVISMGAPKPTEQNYLYAVWRNIAKYIEMEPAMLPSNGRTDIQLLREEIQRLVAGHQYGSYPILPTIYNHINALLGESH